MYDMDHLYDCVTIEAGRIDVLVANVGLVCPIARDLCANLDFL
jgi:NAD(P)-dependent dehydrogenase (short-subunit alcohol dehydrogenase family)